MTATTVRIHAERRHHHGVIVESSRNHSVLGVGALLDVDYRQRRGVRRAAAIHIHTIARRFVGVRRLDWEERDALVRVLGEQVVRTNAVDWGL